MRAKLTSQCVFSTGFLILFPILIFVTAELFITKTKLNYEMTNLQSSVQIQIKNFENMSATFHKDMQQLKRTSNHDHAVLVNLTNSFGAKLNITISNFNDTIKEQSKAVEQKVFNLTQDVGVYVNTTANQFDSQNSMMAFQFAGTFTILGILIFMWHVTNHLRNYNEPFVQRKIIALLWMVPIYGVTSFFSLVFVSSEGFLGIIKDFYEAYCIFMFLSFLIAVLGRGDRAAVVDLLSKHGNNLTSPIHFYGILGKTHYKDAREKADSVLLQCQMATLQFVLLRPLTSIFMVLANELTNAFSISIWDVRYPQFWINLIMNISVFIAFSGLLKFYHAVRDDLVWCQPFQKFLCIKGVVFMTFWQGLVISIIANSSFVETERAKSWSKQAQNFIICLEMFFFSVAHLYAFPQEEWQEGYKPAETVRRKFGDNIALRDFVQDVKLVLRTSSNMSRSRFSSVKKRRKDSTSELEEPFGGEEKGNDLLQMVDEDDLSFVNRIMKEAETLKLEKEDSDGEEKDDDSGSTHHVI